MDPVTPSKDRRINALDSYLPIAKTFQLVSETYGLGLRVPERAQTLQSPMKSRQSRDEDYRLFNKTRILYFHKTLDTALQTYRDRAILVSKKWVHKPGGELDVTPSVTGLPKATNAVEKQDLRKLFEDVLNEFNPNSPGMTLRNGRTTVPIEKSLPIIPQPRPKRPSNDWDHNTLTTKRPKSITSGYSPPEAPYSEPHRPRNRSFYGLSTDSSRETVVFSDTDAPPRFSHGTQTTVEAGTQEKARYQAPGRRRRTTQDSFPISSGSIQALTESFDQFENNQELHDNVRRYLDRSSPTYPYSNLSSLVSEQDPAGLDQCNKKTGHKQQSAFIELDDRLDASWPRLPSSLSDAPFAIIWEVVRVLLHCKLDPLEFDLEYDTSWRDQKQLWDVLRTRLCVDSLPEKSDPRAWDAALGNFFDGPRAVSLTMSLELSSSASGPFFLLDLHPLKIDNTYRLSRRFSPDRFIKMTVPTIDQQNIPQLKTLSNDAVVHIRRWVHTKRHPLLGRLWASFAIRSYRETVTKKSTNKSERYEPEPRATVKDRLYLFAEDGNDFHGTTKSCSLKGEPVDSHTQMTVKELIEWLLEPSNNPDQPVLKLFSRITLGLSRTSPTVVLKPGQIRHMLGDVSSPSGKVMNDGIGRMSPALARKVSGILGLSDTPSAFQGRIGSAKGVWVRDVADQSDDIWIETYPSQRKWKCNLQDEDHRTFEVSSWPKALEPASLNTQFLPILEDRAPNREAKEALKNYIGRLLTETLNEEINAQRAALQDPLQCWLWVDRKSTSRRLDRLKSGEIPRLGSLPRSEEDRVQFLLAGGFEPLRQKFLWDTTWRLCKEKCEELKTRMNIKVGRSVYALMVIDFEGILAEDQVHLGFSSNFQDTLSGFSATFLHGMDVLVARSPAHFVSDVQKVRAVFKPELGFLKDVIVFPMNGRIPLADKLSGGDYDGDKAWVCWDDNIVRNFVSAPVPTGPDLFHDGVLTKRTEKYQALIEKHGSEATSAFLETGFDFNMQPTLLARCTAFKENLCYQRKSVSDDVAVRLSTMLSNLVDQEKQGIDFTNKDFSLFKKQLLRQKAEPPKPHYKSEVWTGKGRPTHIIDYLKFCVMVPAVEAELARLHSMIQGQQCGHWDKDLALYFDKFNELRIANNRRVAHGMKMLQNNLGNFHSKTMEAMSNDKLSFEAKVWQAFELFRSIQPDGFSGTVRDILSIGNSGNQHTQWDLLRASTYFKIHHKTPFIWWIIGSELQALKARSSKSGPITQIIGPIYAALKADAKYVNTRFAQFNDIEEDGDDDDSWTSGNPLERPLV
ncbi:hypothetical protein JX265_007491 [Neoarthrinium moseri]|uniref:RNA-dependent RNA polymerase n=1 Tax=Neoarthrinium moseri TaxID=1658444 RepID=A0A9P9WJJ4_9PEZI|nr:hypothetical protein JX265_007491 [Neoarthrinium moseri]